MSHPPDVAGVHPPETIGAVPSGEAMHVPSAPIPMKHCAGVCSPDAVGSRSPDIVKVICQVAALWTPCAPIPAEDRTKPTDSPDIVDIYSPYAVEPLRRAAALRAARRSRSI